MRTPPLAQAASLYSATQPIRTPPLNRLLVYWPRYLQLRGNGANKQFTTTRLAKDLQHEKRKAYSTNADFQIPLTGISDAHSELYEDTSVADTVQAHDNARDHRYNDPQGYLEDYGVEIPEETIAEWQADLRAHPPTYAKQEYTRWLAKVAKCQPVTVRRNALLDDAKSVQKLRIGGRYQTDSKWKASFLRLYAQFDSRLDAELREPAFLGDPRASEWARPFLEAPDQETMQSYFLNLDGHLASRMWPHIMLYVLFKHPERALEILSVSMFAARQTSAVELVFSFAMEYAISLGSAAGKPYLHEASQFLHASLRPDHIVDHATFEKNIKIFRSLPTISSAQSLYKLLNERGFSLRSWSHLHFAYQLAHQNQIIDAVEALKAAVNAAESTPSPIALSETGAFRSVCNVILRKLMGEKDGYQASLQVVSSLSQLGLRMTAPLINVLMLNAVEAGDTTTCMGLYTTMHHQGIERDSWTYDFALRAMRESEDGDQIQDVVNEAFRYQGEGRKYVQNAAMRCLGTFYARQSQLTAFERLLDIYRQKFDLRPLIKLGIVPTRDEGALPDLLQPDKATIHVMLHYFLTGVEDSTQRIWYMYQTLRQLMRTNRFWAECGTSPYFYASFIHALGRSRQQLKYCPLILRDMLRTSITDGQDSMFDPELVKIRPAAPNTYVMNVLLQAFIRHGHSLAAGKMRDFMRDRNIPADLVTYNSIIAGYARQQDIERAASALKELDADNLEADDFTRGALRFIEDRDALTAAVERGRGPDVQGQGKRWVMASVLNKVNDIWSPRQNGVDTMVSTEAHDLQTPLASVSSDQVNQGDGRSENASALPQLSAQRLGHPSSMSGSVGSIRAKHIVPRNSILEDSDLLRLSLSSEATSEPIRKPFVPRADMSTDAWGEGYSAIVQTSSPSNDSSSSLLRKCYNDNSEAAPKAGDKDEEDSWTSYSPQQP